MSYCNKEKVIGKLARQTQILRIKCIKRINVAVNRKKTDALSENTHKEKQTYLSSFYRQQLQVVKYQWTSQHDMSLCLSLLTSELKVTRRGCVSPATVII